MKRNRPYYQSEITGGELAVRSLSEKAQRYYYESDGVGVRKMDDDRYDVIDFGAVYNDMTLKEVEAFFEEMVDEWGEDE